MFKFGKNEDFQNEVKRNVFDLSFQNNATFKMGYCYPVFCKPVVPTDSFRITPTVAIQMMPTVFPVKTRMNAYLHFFYVRNRNLMPNWKEFITANMSGDNSITIPCNRKWYKEMWKTGGLADYLGLPTALPTPRYSSDSFMRDSAYNGTIYGYSYDDFSEMSGSDIQVYKVQETSKPIEIDGNWLNVSCPITVSSETPNVSYNPNLYKYLYLESGSISRIEIKMKRFSWASPNAYSTPSVALIVEFEDGSVRFYSYTHYGTMTTNIVCNYDWFNDTDKKVASMAIYIRRGFGSQEDSVEYSYTSVYADDNVSPNENGVVIQQPNQPQRPNAPRPDDPSDPDDDVPETPGVDMDEQLTDEIYMWDNYHRGEPGNIGDINILPFRAYESIYNAFYRNWQVDPLKDADGKPLYDTYCRAMNHTLLEPNVVEDPLVYKLEKRNWEKDMVTSCYTSPQQGNAPLVGLTALGDTTFSYDGKMYTAKAEFGDDNETITSFRFGENVPNEVLRAAVNASGFSINDLRNVNSLQRFLENGLRASYKYRNQIAAHFGKMPSFAELDMPEFVGGMSLPLNLNTIPTTADTAAAPAGTPVANGTFSGTGDNVECYCDEHGYIIGVLSIVPVPNYPNRIDKHWRTKTFGDFYSPEFGHLGMQEVKEEEVSALTNGIDYYSSGSSVNYQNTKQNKTFGYNRSWYDMCGSLDEVHGQFRTTMRDYIISRWFGYSTPLNKDFLNVDPSQLNDIFASTDDNDKFIGQLYFDVKAKRPLPEYGSPRLE